MQKSIDLVIDKPSSQENQRLLQLLFYQYKHLPTLNPETLYPVTDEFGQVILVKCPAPILRRYSTSKPDEYRWEILDVNSHCESGHIGTVLKLTGLFKCSPNSSQMLHFSTANPHITKQISCATDDPDYPNIQKRVEKEYEFLKLFKLTKGLVKQEIPYNGKSYIVFDTIMPNLGKDLYWWLVDNPTKNLGHSLYQRMYLAAASAMALNNVLAEGVIHHDQKLENYIYNPYSTHPDGCVRLIDFELASFEDEADTFGGSLFEVAPEIAIYPNYEPRGWDSEVYSFAVVLLEILSAGEIHKIFPKCEEAFNNILCTFFYTHNSTFLQKFLNTNASENQLLNEFLDFFINKYLTYCSPEEQYNIKEILYNSLSYEREARPEIYCLIDLFSHLAIKFLAEDLGCSINDLASINKLCLAGKLYLPPILNILHRLHSINYLTKDNFYSIFFNLINKAHDAQEIYDALCIIVKRLKLPYFLIKFMDVMLNQDSVLLCHILKILNKNLTAELFDKLIDKISTKDPSFIGELRNALLLNSQQLQYASELIAIIEKPMINSYTLSRSIATI